MELDIEALCSQSETAVQALRVRIRGLGSALVAFSGGVDSTFVLKIAVDELGEKCVALTAISPSVAADEAEEARALAVGLGAQHELVDSHELEDPRYAANPSNRCYFFTTELYTLTEKACARLGLSAVLDCFNADDKKDREKIKRMLKVWIANGLFQVVMGKNEKGRDTPFIQVGELA